MAEFNSGHNFGTRTHTNKDREDSITHTHTDIPPSLEEVLVLDTTASQPMESGVGVGAHMSGLALREEFRSGLAMNQRFGLGKEGKCKQVITSRA